MMIFKRIKQKSKQQQNSQRAIGT